MALLSSSRVLSLNAPFGARYFLTSAIRTWDTPGWSLNAPYDARCFLTCFGHQHRQKDRDGLNAPFGARCYLTVQDLEVYANTLRVLMHLMALGAFRRFATVEVTQVLADTS